MSRRFTLGWLVALAVSSPAAGFAQSGYEGYGYQSYGQPAQAAPAGYQGYASPDSGYGPNRIGVDPNCPPGPGGVGYGPGPGGPYTTYQEYPDDAGFLYADSPLERMLKETFRHGFFRVEYMNLDIREPGPLVVGRTGTDPSTVNFFADPVSGALVGTSTVANTGSVQINDNSGVRGTWGLPVAGGTVELSSFVLQTSTAYFEGAVNPVSSATAIDAQVVIIPFLVNGALTGNALGGDSFAFDQRFTLSYKTSLWGAEGNYVYDAFDPNSNFQIRPLVGFKYLNFREDMGIRGSSSFGQVAGTFTDDRINSSTNNNQYGPQIGLRAEWVEKYFTFGAEPKAMLGVNSYTTDFNSQLTFPTQTVQQFQTFREDGTTFAPVFDLSVYGKAHLTDYFSLFVNYQFMYSGFLTRPESNFTADVTEVAGQQTLDFQFDPKFTDIIVQGITIGGELRY